ncbi:hypothetical protein LMH87_006452 [Akanthomyces muscarius]|uniref:Uncharacterized protein n=1 Tax=Akanthomyces muscarius TaxID=2231603 RepID=A0A9W8QR67_AKAMU|nr:hypothetical protein LMH87_006452 [Akanthomyces muscarius]KAJ4164792.1 hypothetical protein LMH87_006452 [Akanthomyces muscarius]
MGKRPIRTCGSDQVDTALSPSNSIYWTGACDRGRDLVQCPLKPSPSPVSYSIFQCRSSNNGGTPST